MVITQSVHEKSTEAHRVVSFVFVCGFACALLFGGCQKSNDQYQTITEEMTQEDVAEETSQTKNPKDQINSPPENLSLTAKTTVPLQEETSAGEATSSEASESLGTRENPPKEKHEASVEEVLSNKTTDTLVDAQPANKMDSGAVQGFINLEEEIARQNRINKLGLGTEAKSLEPREPKLLVTEREFSQESDSGAWRLSYNDLDLLKILNMEPVPLNADEYLPGWLTQLDGKQVILRGWMFPPDRNSGIKGFIFVRDNQVCCFGPNAKAYDKLVVRLQSGTTTKYIQGRPFDVIGTFKIDPWIEEERDPKTGAYIETLGMLYHLNDAIIVDKN